MTDYIDPEPVYVNDMAYFTLVVNNYDGVAGYKFKATIVEGSVAGYGRTIAEAVKDLSDIMLRRSNDLKDLVEELSAYDTVS